MLMEWNRAAEKLSLTLRKKGHASDPAPSQLSTCFREIIQKNPPPVPTCLLQAHIKLICTTLKRISQPPVLRIDPSKKRVTIVEPATKSHQRATMTLGRDGKSHLKTFTFDSAYPQESSQAEVCAGVLADVIRCVLSGSDACVLGLGCADVGELKTYSFGENIGKLGLIPCAISWLYSAIERRRERTWTDLSVSVSAIELCCGEEDTLRDLLGEVVPSLGSIHDSPKAHIKLQEDPVYGAQVEQKVLPLREGIVKLLPLCLPYLCTLWPNTHMTLHCFCRSGKLTLLLRESLGHTSCHTTVIAQIMDSLAHLQENFSTIQLAARFRRTQKRTKQTKLLNSTSCSPCARSLTREKRGLQSFSLRAFHSTDEVDVDIRPFRLRDELDERSSSEQSCDTVIQIDSDGSVHPRSAPRQALPEFVPIIPIPQLQVEKTTESALLGQTDALKGEKKQPERDCLKCDTFAQLQERLGCIDGSEMTMDVLRSSLKGLNNVPVKSQHQEESVKRADAEAPQTLLIKGSSCSQTSAAEKQTDGAGPGDSFQREDSGLYDCEECSATSSSEELLNQTLGLNATCRSEPSNTRTLKSGNGFSSKRFNVDAKVKAGASSLALEPSHKQEKAETADWFKTDKRTSPVGKSSPISPSSTCSSSHSLAKSVILADVLNSRPKQEVKEMKATITVTVQQPLDLKGQDELVFSMVEEVTISGAYDRARTGGNIICIRDGAHSQAQAEDSASSQPIQIISNVGEESAASGSSGAPESSAVHPAGTEKSQHQVRREKRAQVRIRVQKKYSEMFRGQGGPSAGVCTCSFSQTFGHERTSSFFPSSPPRSHRSVSRTPSQSSTSSSTKSAIQGFVNGRLADFLKERAPSPTIGGSDQTTSLPSPYSQLTSPRMPDRLSGHASDTTSVLSGDLPPAMGKTSLHFSNRNSLVSSGYDSMVRDSEATGSSTSARDSVSDRSSSLLGAARSGRSKQTNRNTQQRHLSHDSPLTLRRSASGLRSRWMDQGIPEAYEIKVYEIDNVQRMQERAGAGKQGPTCFSAKLKLLEHRQQRISEVRKCTWHTDPYCPSPVDLWQTFEVDSLEHLEALELVTARLERKVSLCKANVMMVTCFDGVSRRRCSFHKKGISCHQ
uniref:Kinesin motor domain-containing protein n=1 Tax=Neolamprologus brichardi TaxID=32507 RepID=A0A3Q4HZU2_NEOBR